MQKLYDVQNDGCDIMNVGQDTSYADGREGKMFKKYALKHTADYDKTGKIPVIRASICTGEKVAGFKDESTGKFDDLMLIKNDKDLRQFLKMYGVDEREIKREW